MSPASSSKAQGSAKPREFARTKTAGVYRRRTGAFVAIWRGGDGKTHSRSFAAYEDAVLFKAELKRDRRRGTLSDPPRLTVSEYLDEWLERYTGRTRRGIGQQTLADYRADLEAVRALIGHERLVGLSHARLRRLVGDLLAGEDRRPAQPRAPRTVAKVLAPLRAALADAIEDDLIPRNPAEGVRVRARTGSEEPKPKRRALSDGEVMAIIVAAPPTRPPAGPACRGDRCQDRRGGCDPLGGPHPGGGARRASCRAGHQAWGREGDQERPRSAAHPARRRTQARAARPSS